MLKYKTVVTDYEGMQGVLDTHAAQGWRLFSLSPDTWRKSDADQESGGIETSFDVIAANGKQSEEFSASYYLLVFQRDTRLEEAERLAAVEEAFPADLRQAFEV